MQNEFYFSNRKPIEKRLLSYGFTSDEGTFRYRTSLLDGQFIMTVVILPDDKVLTELKDSDTDEEFTLHLSSFSKGTFIGKVREAYEQILSSIDQNCFEHDRYQSDLTRKIIFYVEQKYGDRLEFLWEKFSENAIWRRKDNAKWYGALLVIPESRLGYGTDEPIEILDLREDADVLSSLVDHQKYFPGYHMNKKHWITIPLDGRVPYPELCERIDRSYEIAAKK